MTEFIFVRHAKTDWNNAGRIQGRSDIPLSADSIPEVRKAAENMQDMRIDEVFSSPLIRAVQTARLLTEGRNLEIHTDGRLIERDFGEYDGKTYAEIGLADHNKLFYEMRDVKNAEPIADVFSRARSFIEDISERYDGKTVLVVSHGVCISLLTYALTHSAFSTSDYDLEYIKNLTFARHRVGGEV